MNPLPPLFKRLRDWLRAVPAEPVAERPVTESLMLALEPRILFDAAALVVGATLLYQEQETATTALPAPAMDPLPDLSVAPTPVFMQEGHGSTARQMLVVDPTVSGWHALVEGLDPAVSVLVLDPRQDGVAQIGAALAGETGITALHILSHGAQGAVHLGTGVLSVQTMAHYAEPLQHWGDALTADGDILIYGCDVGAGSAGRALLDGLADWTGADLAASDDRTGAARRGGDWTLEVHSGPIEAVNPLSQERLAAFEGVLTAPVAFTGLKLDSSDSDATNDYVDVAKTTLFQTGTSGTVSLWFRIDSDSVGNEGVLFSSGTDAANDFSIYAASDGSGGWGLVSVAQSLDTIAATISKNTWHHLAIAWDSTADTANIYLDGNSTPTAVSSINFATWSSTVTLGGYTNHGSTYLFPGSLADVRSWSGAVSLDSTGWKSAPVGGTAIDLLSYSAPQEDVNKTLTLGGADLVDPSTLSLVTITTLPTRGSLWQTTDGTTPTVQITAINTDVTDSKGRVIFVPTANSNGADAFTFKVQDANGEWSSSSTTSYTIAAVNDAPVMGAIRNLAVDMDGANDYIQAPLPTVINNGMTQNFTIEFVARVDDLAAHGTYTRLLEARFNNNNDIQFNVPQNNKVQVVVFDSGASRGVSSNVTPLVAGTWHHFAAVWTAATSSVQLYIDGVAQSGAELGSSGVGNSSELRLGSRTDNQGRMDGAIDEVRIWNTTRTQAQIAANRGIALTGSEAGLLDYWSFDEGQGVTSRDWGSGGRTMTLTNMATPANNWIDSGLPVTENSTTNKLWVLEDGQRVIQLSGISDVDTAAASLQYRITTLPAQGKLYQYNAGVKGAQIAANDLLTDASGRMFWEPDANYYGTDTLQANGWDGALSSLNTATLNLTVASVNDAPVNTLPAAQSVAEDGTLVFSTGNGTLISIADVDVGTNLLQITLTAGNGRITLSQLTGLTFTTGDGTADATMTFTGTLANVTAALAGSSFAPTANYSGAATLTLTSNDQGNSGSGGALSDTDILAITVTGVADTPTVTNATTTEETQSNTGLVINRNGVDGAEVGYFKITGITGGTLYLNDGTTQVTNNQFLTAAQISPRLRFTPSPGLTTAGGGVFTFTVWASTTNDDSGLGSGSATATITVNPVNDPPVNTVPAAQTLVEDAPLVFSTANGNAVSVTDDASEGGLPIKSTLTVNQGVLTVAGSSGATVTGNGTATVVVTGTVAQVNAELQGMIYQPATHYFGADTFQIKTNDQGNTGAGGAKTTTNTVALTITPLADIPAVTNATTTEDLQTSSGLVITRHAADGAEVVAYKITDIVGGTLYQNNGTTPINANDFITIAQGSAGLRFTPSANFTGSGSFKIWASTAANDTGLGGSVTATITVNAQNDAPVNTVPAAQSLVEDTLLVFSTANGTAISTADADAGGANVQMTVTAGNGTFTLSQTTGLVFSTGDGTADAAMTFTGTLANINAALAGASFAPTADYVGAASVTLTTNDQGNTGAGGAKSDTDSIVITLTSVPDTPTVTAATTNEDTQTGSGLVISRATGDGADVGFFKITGITGGLLYRSDGTTAINNNDFITAAQGSAGLRFTPSANQNSGTGGPFQFTVQASLSAVDAGLGGTLVTVPITVNAVNDLPVLTAGSSSTFTENGASIPVDTTVTVADVDHTALTGATVTVSGGYQSGADLLSFADILGITGSWSGATGVLTLSGTTSLVNYQTALASVRYINSSEAPTAGARTIAFVGTDGVDSSVAATATITVVPVIDAPVLTSGNVLNYSEGDAATAFDTGITLTDLDSANMVGAVVTFSSGYQAAEDLLAFTDANGITGSWDGLTGTLTLAGLSSQANYQAALRSITYANTGGDNPTTGDRTLSLTIQDGSVSSAAVTATVRVSALNDAPVVTSGAVVTVTEGDGATPLDGTLTLADGDTLLLNGATVTLGAGFVATEDQLGFTDANGIAGLWNGASGVLTLSGVATVAQYQAALRSVQYSNLAGEAPTAGNRTVSWQASDGAATSVAATATLTMVAVDDRPVVTAGAATGYTEGDGSRVIDATVTVGDLDSPLLASATLRLGAGFVAGEDRLEYTGGLTKSWNGATGVLTLTGAASAAAYRDALRSVTYLNDAGDAPTAGVRTLSFQVNDGTSDSLVVTSTVTITAVNDAPVLTAGGVLNYTEGDVATILDGGITVTDADHLQLQRARVVIAAGYISGEDQLSFVNTGSIAGSWDTTTGSLVLNLTGAATVADYQAALRSIQYGNTAGDNPTAGTRTVSLLVDDGTSESAAGVTATVQVTAVNDAPTVVAGGAMTFVENSAATVVQGNITLSDPDNTQLTGATVALSAGYAAEDLLGFVNANGITGSWNGAGTLTLSGTATVLTYQNALRSITYANTAGDAPTAGVRTLSYRLDDGTTLSPAVTGTVTVQAINDAPVWTVPGDQTLLEDTDLTLPAITLADADAGNAPLSITLSVSDGTLILASTAGLTFSAGGDNQASMTFTGTQGAINTALANLVYSGGADADVDDVLVLQANDQGNSGDGGAQSRIASVALAVIAVNDPPVLDVNAGITVSEGGTVTVVGFPPVVAQLHASDVEQAAASLTYTLGGVPVNGTLRNNGVPLGVGGQFTQDDLDNDRITYRHSGSETTTDSFSVAVTDGQGGSWPQTLVAVTVTPVNDLPVLAANTGGTLNEGASLTIGNDRLQVTDVDNTAAQLGFTLTVLPTRGVLQRDAATLNVNAVITQADLDTGRITYRHDGSETVADLFRFTVDDGAGGTIAETTFALTINPVNDQPVLLTNTGATLSEGDSRTLNGAFLAATDADNSAVQLAYRVTSTPDYGQLTRSGTALAVADTFTQDDLDNNRLVYTHNGGETVADLFRFTVADGSGGTIGETAVALTITPANDTPVVTAGGVATHTEGDGTTLLDGTLTVTDADHLVLQGATITFSSGYLGGEDRLLFTDTGTLSGSWNGGTGVLTLSGAASVAEYQAALRGVGYSNIGGDNPTGGDRTLAFTLSDGSGTSAAATSLLHVVPVNDRPVMTAGATLAYTENAAATPVDATLTVQDGDNTTLAGALVQFSAGYVSGQDRLEFTDGGGITGVWSGAGGTLTLSGSATVAAYQAALRSVTYRNSDGDTPTAGTRTVAFSVQDGALGSTVVTSQVGVTAVNDAPTLNAGGLLNYTENGASQAVDNAITLQDVDSPTLASATVTISGGYDAGKDVLSYGNTADITSSWDGATGRLTLVGVASQAAYQSALRAVAFANTSDDPAAGDRTLQMVVNDGALASPVATATVRVTAVNDRPVVTGLASVNYVEGSPAVAVAAALGVTDGDNLQLQGATLAITSGHASGQDQLLFTDGNGITGSWNGAAGILTLSGAATVADYQAAVRSVTYANSSVDNPTAGGRTVTITLNDGAASSTAAALTLTVQAVNDAPQVVPGAALAFTEGNGTVVVDGALQLSDADHTLIQGATVEISVGYRSGEDQLNLASTAAITSQWDAVTGLLTLSGAATVAEYQAALRGMTYQNLAGDNPTAGARTLLFLVNDGQNSSLATNGSIVVTAVNDAPVLGGGTVQSYTEGDAARTIDSTLTITDADSPNLASATVDFISGFVAGQDLLQFTSTASIVGSWDGTNGVLTLTGAASTAAYQAALASVTYANSSVDDPTAGTRTVRFRVHDGGSSSGQVTSNVVVTAIDDRPTITAGGTRTHTEGGAAAVVDGAIVLGDMDNANLTHATVTIRTGYRAGEDRLSFTDTGSIMGVWDAATGTLTLSGASSVGAYQSALRSVFYDNLAGDAPNGGVRSVVFAVHDGTLESLEALSTVQVVAVNDLPTVTSGAVLAYTEGDAAMVVDGALTVADQDSTLLERATVTLTGALVSDNEQLSGTSAGGIAVAWDGTSKTLTLTGSASAASYQTVLRSVTYLHTDGNAPTAGNRTVTFMVHDGVGNSNSATATVGVTAVNDAPVITGPGLQSGTEDLDLTIAPVVVADVDAGSGDLAVSLTVNEGTLTVTPTNLSVASGGNGQSSMVLTGSLSHINAALATIVYRGRLNYNGADTLSVQVSDQGEYGSGGVRVTTQSVAISLAAVNDAPVSGGDVVLVTNEDTNLLINVGTSILANDSDVDGDGLTATIATWPDSGTLTAFPDGTWRYAPQQNINGAVSFTYTLSDGQGGSATGTVTLIINPIQDALQAANDTVNPVAEDGVVTSGSVLSNDRDPDYHVTLWDAGLNPALAVIGFAQPGHGVAVYNGDGTFTYTPTADYYGSDALVYTLWAGDARLDTGTVSFTVTSVNDAPDLIRNTGVAVAEGGDGVVGDMQIKVTDIEQAATALIFSLEAAPTYGTLLKNGVALAVGENFTQADVDANRIVYRHGGSETLADTFNFSVTDGAGATLFPSSVAIAVTPVNDAPLVAVNSGASLLEGGTVTIRNTLLRVTDVDNTAGQLQFTVATAPLYGTLTLDSVALGAGATFSQFELDSDRLAYSHGGSENFSDGFNVTVSDGAGGQVGNTRFALSLTNVNDAPVLAVNTARTVNEGGSGAVDGTVLSVTDAEQAADSLQYRLTQLPVYGLLRLNGVALAVNEGFTQADVNAQRLTYLHDGSETLGDAFQWVVTDGTGGTTGEKSSALVIAPVNDAPQLGSTAQPITYTENDPAVVVNGTVLASDVDSAQFQSAVVSISSGYMPGEDRLSFTPVGGIAGSWDAASGVLTLSGAGTLAEYHAALRSVTYQLTAAAQENPTAGLRTVGMTLHDGGLGSNTVTNTVSVVPVNDRPAVVAGGVLAYTEGDPATALAATLLLTDPDSPFMEGAIVTVSGGHLSNQDRLAFVDHWGIAGTWDDFLGTLTLSGHASRADYQSALRSITYQNTAGDVPTAGTRTVTIVVQDEAHSSVAVTGQVTVTAVNDAPLLTAPDFQSVAEDASLLLTGLSLQDPDSGTGVLQMTLLASHGTLTLGSATQLQFLSGGNGTGAMVFTGRLEAMQYALDGMRYQGNADYNGLDTLILQVSDLGNGGSGPVGLAEKSVLLLVQPVADPPVAGVDAFMMAEDAPLLISTAQLLANDVDVDGDGLMARVTLDVRHGSLTDLGGGMLRYVPEQDYNGVDSFLYTVLDGRGGSGIGRVTLIVNPIEDALWVDDDAFTLDEDVPASRLSVLANDRDPDLAGTLTVIGFTPAAHGTLIHHDDGTFSYTPDAHYFGQDRFTYVVNTGDARIGRGTVTLNINPVNDPPALQTNVTMNALQGRSSWITQDLLRAVDLEQGAEDIVFTLAVLPSHGEVIKEGRALGVGGSFTQADLDAKRVSYKHNGSRTTQDTFKFILSDRVSPQWSRVGTFHVSIEKAYDVGDYVPTVSRESPLVLPEVVIPKRFLVPATVPGERPVGVWASENSVVDGGRDLWSRHSVSSAAAPILTVLHHGEFTVELDDSGTPLLTAVTNSNPGVQDGAMVMPVLNAVRSSVASVAPGGLQTPLLTAVIAESSRGNSPVLGGFSMRSGFAVQSGWFYFGPEFDLPEEGPVSAGDAEWTALDPDWFIPGPAPVEGEGLHAQIRRLDSRRAEEAAALLAALAQDNRI